mmetsp:Transcript_18975/g.59659  ORF Transcript_18975/g.59659 Transcript_18975/m.59659 type:complete len:349 (+) Transcript_18975:127-1173(+)
MGLGMSTCTKLLFDPDLDYLHDNCKQGSLGDCPAKPASGPQLALRIAYSPIEESLGARLSPFAAGDEIAVMHMERVKGWDPLSWRQERSAKQRAAIDSASSLAWPEGPRFSAAQRFWGAKVVASDGSGGFEEHWCMLQIAVSPKDRGMDSVKPIIDDAKEVASYAHRFNMQTARACGAEDEPAEAPGVRVCAPVGCYVLGSAVPELAQPGEAVSLSVYPAPTVKKFVFEGAEDFVELPQAFFHYVAWLSGGKESVGDLQGVQDDQDVVLVDPVMLRAPKPGIGDLLGTLASSGGQDDGAKQLSVEQHRFDLWHPRCGQLCRAFDPQRRTAHARRACGMSLPSCGVGGA